MKFTKKKAFEEHEGLTQGLSIMHKTFSNMMWICKLMEKYAM